MLSRASFSVKSLKPEVEKSWAYERKSSAWTVRYILRNFCRKLDRSPRLKLNDTDAREKKGLRVSRLLYRIFGGLLRPVIANLIVDHPCLRRPWDVCLLALGAFPFGGKPDRVKRKKNIIALRAVQRENSWKKVPFLRALRVRAKGSVARLQSKVLSLSARLVEADLGRRIRGRSRSRIGVVPLLTMSSM